MAAAYLFHIVQNHPFVDGIKRAGAVAAHIFLQMNGVQFTASEQSYEALVRAVAQGKTRKPAIAEFLRRHSGKKSRSH